MASKHGFSYSAVKADIDEKAIRHPDPVKLVSLLAEAKAEAILPQLQSMEPGPDVILITCDQVVTHEGRILEKPEDEAEARRYIDGYGRSPAATVSSVLCTNLRTGQKHLLVDQVHITFKPIPKEVVDQLIQEGEIFWCAGGLQIEHPAVQPYIVSIGGAMDSVMGLPKHAVMEGVVAVATL